LKYGTQRNFSIKLRLLFGMGPDTDPISHVALRIVPDLMRPLGLKMLYSHQTSLTWLPELRLQKLSIFSIWQLLARPREMSHINLWRQRPRRTTSRRRLIRWELHANDSSFRSKQFREAFRPRRSHRRWQSRQELGISAP
jgi:hypothetical protein